MTGSRPWYTVLYVQVIIAILIGIAVGYVFPETGKRSSRSATASFSSSR